MTDEKKPSISIIVTVFNKAAELPLTIQSLRRQLPEEEVEYIFVDDRSMDDSVEVMQQALADAPNKRIIVNMDNRGPSVRLNQAVGAARGEYLFIMDGDDIAPAGLLAAQRTLLEKHQADFIYGRTLRSKDNEEQLLSYSVDENKPCDVIDQPLDYVCSHKLVRMSLMVRRETFARARGCDERIFIQDISLPLRLGKVAKRMLFWHENVLIMPVTECEHLSGNKTQQHHDQFLSFYSLLDSLPEEETSNRRRLYQNMVSAMWKHHRGGRWFPWFSPMFMRYLGVKLFRPKPNARWIRRAIIYLMGLSGVRRCG